MFGSEQFGFEQKGDCMGFKRMLGGEIHGLSHLIKRKLNSVFIKNGADGITPMHGRILGYLLRNSDREIYQRDIETEFRITRSSVTGLLKLMEEKGYIQREEVAKDARLKRIVITPIGRRNFERIESSIREVEELMRAAVTPEEYDMLLRLIDQIKAVL